MSSASWYRAQAENMLHKAEAAEKMEVIKELPIGTVITFSRKHGVRDKRLSFAAILVDTFSAAKAATAPIYRERYATNEPKWFVTQHERGSVSAKSSGDFARWLLDGEVDDVLVIDGVVTLAQWRERVQAYAKDLVAEGYPGEATVDEVATNLRAAAQKARRTLESEETQDMVLRIADEHARFVERSTRRDEPMGANDPQEQ